MDTNFTIQQAIAEMQDFAKETPMFVGSPKAAYAALIDKISGKGTFESNPWVFVYEFKLVK